MSCYFVEVSDFHAFAGFDEAKELCIHLFSKRILLEIAGFGVGVFDMEGEKHADVGFLEEIGCSLGKIGTGFYFDRHKSDVDCGIVFGYLIDDYAILIKDTKTEKLTVTQIQ